MKKLKRRFTKMEPVLVFFLILNALLWTLQAGNKSSVLTSNVYVSLIFAILHLIGAGIVFSNWQKNRQLQKSFKTQDDSKTQ